MSLRTREKLVSRTIADRAILCLAVGLLFLPASAVSADESLKGVACRSVHLGFDAPAGSAFYNEVTIEKSAPGSFFMVCGWDQGYFGLQELADGKKLAIFSVWDSKNDDPQATPEERRVRVVCHDPAVRAGRFGNEGSGGPSFFPFDWQTGETYRCLLTGWIDGARTEYSGFLYLPKDGAWRRLVTFSTPNGGKPLRGCYCFLEDFRRNRISATQIREARFGNGWVRNVAGDWLAIRRARFTADANPVLNIDAGLRQTGFFLATGGETVNSGVKLKDWIDSNDATDGRKPPVDLPEIPR